MNRPPAHPQTAHIQPAWRSFAEMTGAHAAQHPDGLALTENGRAMNWAEFEQQTLRATRWLAEQGVGPGDRVAVWLANHWEWLVLLVALARRGACVVTVNTRYRSSELHYILEKSAASMLIYEPSFHKIDFAQVLAGVNLAELPALKTLAVLRAPGDAPAVGPGGIRQVRCEFETLAPLAQDLSDADAPVMLFTTSGTTKGPKLVTHTQRTLLLHTARLVHAYEFDQPGASLLAVIPFCGVFGFNATWGAMYARAPLVVMDTFEVDEALALIARHQITHLYGSDDMGKRLQEKLVPPRAGSAGSASAEGVGLARQRPSAAPTLPQAEQAVAGGVASPLPSLRRFGFASFVSSAEDFGIPAREMGLPVMGLYGSSEVQALFSMQDKIQGTEQIVKGGGRPAGDTAIQLRVRDAETGQLLPDGEAGELEVKADSNFVGYLNDPESTAQAIDAEGYFKTGDLAYLRGDGTFVYLARMGDAMRLGGFLVSPVEIESQLMALPDVALAQVVEVRVNDKPACAAFVIANAGAQPEPDALRVQLRERLAAFKLPARIWVVAEFPVTQGANGTKVQRAALRKMAAERLSSEK